MRKIYRERERERGYRTYIHICYHPVTSVLHGKYSLPHQEESTDRDHGTLHYSRRRGMTHLKVLREILGNKSIKTLNQTVTFTTVQRVLQLILRVRNKKMYTH